MAEKYFQGFTANQLKITYILWTEALSFEELDSKEAIEADCLEVWLGEQLKLRQKVIRPNVYCQDNALIFTLHHKSCYSIIETCIFMESIVNIKTKKIRGGE